MNGVFALVAEPAHWWPVHFDVAADGGRVEKVTIELKFARLGVDDFHEVFMAAAGVLRDRAEQRAHDRLVFDRVVRGWRKVADAEGSPAPFADPFIARLLDVANFPEAMGLAYAKFWRAIPETVEGNSEPSPAGGPATGDGMATAEATATGRTSKRRSGAGARATRK